MSNVIWLTKLFLVLSVFANPFAQAEEPLVWSFAPFAPHIYSLSNGQPAGPFADIVVNTLKQARINYLPMYTPNKRARKAINSGLADFSIGPLTALDNPQDFHISDAVVATVDMRAFWIGERAAIKDISDFAGKSVILITEFQYSGLRQFFEEPSNNVSIAVNVEDHRRALSALALQRADYMIGYMAPVELMQLEQNIADLQSQQLKKADIYLFINKKVKNSRQIIDKINQAYAELYLSNDQKDGE